MASPLTGPLPRRGGRPRRLQDQDGHLRDTSEPGRPHVGQLPDLAPVRGGETLHRLLHHQQRQVPALTRAPPERQGEPPPAARPAPAHAEAQAPGWARAVGGRGGRLPCTAHSLAGSALGKGGHCEGRTLGARGRSRRPLLAGSRLWQPSRGAARWPSDAGSQGRLAGGVAGRPRSPQPARPRGPCPVPGGREGALVGVLGTSPHESGRDPRSAGSASLGGSIWGCRGPPRVSGRTGGSADCLPHSPAVTGSLRTAGHLPPSPPPGRGWPQ